MSTTIVETRSRGLVVGWVRGRRLLDDGAVDERRIFGPFSIRQTKSKRGIHNNKSTSNPHGGAQGRCRLSNVSPQGREP